MRCQSDRRISELHLPPVARLGVGPDCCEKLQRARAHIPSCPPKSPVRPCCDAPQLPLQTHDSFASRCAGIGILALESALLEADGDPPPNVPLHRHLGGPLRGLYCLQPFFPSNSA
eukprot:6187987-Pleurochrysis_carterae.AAC.2